MADILIVEDEKNMQDIISEYMRRGGHTCFTADDGVDALMLMKNNPMDLMVLDIMMPHLDGFSVCKMAREMSSLPIVVALALNLMGGIDLSSVAEFQFGVLENDLSARTLFWLERYGSVTAYKTQEELTAAINEPSTYMIGVMSDRDSISTLVSGDELDLFRQTADTLPAVLCYFVPSSAAFDGIMNLAGGDKTMIVKDIFILIAHCLIWFLLYVSISKRRKSY